MDASLAHLNGQSLPLVAVVPPATLLPRIRAIYCTDGNTAPSPSTTSSERDPTTAPDSEDSEASLTVEPTMAPDSEDPDAAPTLSLIHI